MNYLTQPLDVGGQRTRVLDVGAGDVVLVLHGWGGRIESMAPVVDCLRQNRRVLALDLPGFGEAPVPEEVWGTADQAKFVAEALMKLGVGRAHLVGHSFGALTCVHLAASFPELVDKVVLAAASGLRNAVSKRVRARRAVSRAARTVGRLGPPGRRLKGALYGRLASEDYKQAGPLRPMLIKVVNDDVSHLLPLVASPTLLVWGTADDSVPVEHARTMERLIPDAGLVLFEGAGHFAYLEEPERFCRVVRHFLEH
jgi:pimeloyl-ACP methyl ester carboxylesterase